MEALKQRADQADDLLKKLLQRVKVLESKKSSGPVEVGIHKEVKQKIRAEVVSLRQELQKAHDENKALKAELKKSAKAGVSSDFKKKTDENWELAKAKAKALRAEVQGLESENEALKAEISSLKNTGQTIKTDKLTQEHIDWLKNRMHKVRSDMLEYMKKGQNISADVKPAAAPAAGSSGKEKMTMETVQDLKYYTVTTDLAELKKEWKEAELGELDDCDMEIYLDRKVRVIEIEEDDDTCNCRLDNHDTQWFPVGCLYKDVPAGSAPAPTPAAAAPASNLVQQTMETIKERKMYTVTKDLTKLKKEWYEAELGELDDEDFMIYLGREVKSLDVESDDETVNVRFDNHDTQYFPVTCLYKTVEGAAPAAKPAAKPAAPAMEKMTLETLKERKYYFVTSDLTMLKKEWYAAELGELDDDDFKIYLGREVYAIDTEEDDETINVRFDNHDTQWFPVGCLYRKAVQKPASVNGNLKKQNMDSIKERKTYYVTKDLAELKKEWYEAELGELDDEDFMKYLGREVKTIDIEEDDETVNVRFDNHDSQWFPVTSLYQ